MEYDATLRKVIEFHGHVCPGLAYGYRAAQVALRELGDRSEDEEIVAVVENDSCSVDACEACGEKVMETRIRDKKGRKLCIPCSE